MNLEEKYRRFEDAFMGTTKRNEALSRYTSFQTGGDADLFVDITDAQQMADALRLTHELDIPRFVLGGGSNVLVSDDGFRGLIIRNHIRGLAVQDNEVIAGAGEQLDDVVDYATTCSLTGAEFASGIWGTVGGAVYGNAGAYGSQIGSVLKCAELVDATGNIRTENREYFAFAYRTSILKKTGEVVTKVTLTLHAGDKSEIARRTDEIRRSRSQKHPADACSAGCFFKNIEDPSQPNGKLAAGKLLEESGAKEVTVGHAAVFARHANIIVNTGGARSQEIRRLADILKKRVKEKFNVDLQEEVICVGNFNPEVVSSHT